MKEKISFLRGIKVNNPVEARNIIPLNGEWHLTLDDKNIGMVHGWAEKKLANEYSLNIPSAIQTSKAINNVYPANQNSPTINSCKCSVWLNKEFSIDSLNDNQQVWLKFGGISPKAHVWLNGKLLGTIEGPMNSIKFNATAFIKSGRNHLTVVIQEHNHQFKSLVAGYAFKAAWSGIYRSVELEICNQIHIEYPQIIPDVEKQKVSIKAIVYNDSEKPLTITPKLKIKYCPDDCDVLECAVDSFVVKANSSKSFKLTVSAEKLKLWSPENAELYSAVISLFKEKKLLDEISERFGMRNLTCVDGKLLLNGNPLFIRGVGYEYFSPTISPVIDRKIIRQRLEMLKSFGFNFVRCHTHPVSPEELDVADEVGMLFSSEAAVVSNFCKLEPFEYACDVLKYHVQETRNNPSMGIYCLGNEGSQILVKSETERQHAKIAYNLIKELSPSHPVMIAFGLDNEMPELANDIESPHLWSDDFTWAYEGLTQVPWQGIIINNEKPQILHEYGKFGVWPDPAEKKLYPENTYTHFIAEQSTQALKDAGMASLEQKIIKTSRELHDVCNREIIEMSRSVNGIDGYVIWTAYRSGAMNSGFCDDMGKYPNLPGQPEIYKTGCNAPVALVINNGFTKRTFFYEQKFFVGLYLSNFGNAEIENGTIEWELIDQENKNVVSKDCLNNINAATGDNINIGSICLNIPEQNTDKLFVLKAVLLIKDKVITVNNWKFWGYQESGCNNNTRLISTFMDKEIERNIHNIYPACTSFDDADSISRGCHTWNGIDIIDTLKRFKPQLLISDNMNDVVKQFLDNDGTVIMLDTGNLPEQWYPPELTLHNKGFNMNMMYSSFRSGWGQGNIATVIEEHPVIEEFPHDDFCDLQFYHQIQYAIPLRTEFVASELKIKTKTPIIRSIPKLKPTIKDMLVLQDQNAVKDKKQIISSNIATEDRAYLYEIKALKGRLIVCSLRCFSDPAGKSLLSKIIQYGSANCKGLEKGETNLNLCSK